MCCEVCISCPPKKFVIYIPVPSWCIRLCPIFCKEKLSPRTDNYKMLSSNIKWGHYKIQFHYRLTIDALKVRKGWTNDCLKLNFFSIILLAKEYQNH